MFSTNNGQIGQILAVNGCYYPRFETACKDMQQYAPNTGGAMPDFGIGSIKCQWTVDWLITSSYYLERVYVGSH